MKSFKQTISLFILVTLSISAFSGWSFDSNGIGYAGNFQGNASGFAEIVTTVDGTKQVIFRVKPLNEKSCLPQGRKNGNASYILDTKVLVNDTMVYTK